MKPHEETAAKELLDRLRKSNPELARQPQDQGNEIDESEECPHGVLFSEPCWYCVEEDEYNRRSEDQS